MNDTSTPTPKSSIAMPVLLLGLAVSLSGAALGIKVEVPRDPLLADALPRALAMGGLAALCAALSF